MSSTDPAPLKKYQSVIAALLYANSVSVFLFVARAIESSTIRYWFLLWNLVLGWLPVLFAYWLCQRLRHSRWLSWPNIVLSLLWLGFLPNSFYIISDLVHLHSTGEVSILYDSVMMMSFIVNGLFAGFLSLSLMHKELNKRLRHRYVLLIISLVLLASSFAIYLGRYLRWNTWDVLINPAGLLFDVSERVINPGSYDQAFITTTIFFLLLSSIYTVVWQLRQAARR